MHHPPLHYSQHLTCGSVTFILEWKTTMTNLHYGSNDDHNQEFLANKFSQGSCRATRRQVIDSLTPPVTPSCIITPVKRCSKKSPHQVRARPCRGKLWISPGLGESWHYPPISTMKEFQSSVVPWNSPAPPPPSYHLLTMLPLFALLPLLASASPLTSHKAASPLTNLGCQCSSLTFVDSAGQVPD